MLRLTPFFQRTIIIIFKSKEKLPSSSDGTWSNPYVTTESYFKNRDWGFRSLYEAVGPGNLPILYATAWICSSQISNPSAPWVLGSLKHVLNGCDYTSVL